MDQFWNLPDPIIHHIFSFLEMDDIARIGVVSKRFRQMFVSGPYLRFVSKCFYDGPRIRAINLLILIPVDGLLSQRNGMAIQCLCLDWYCRNNNCDADVNLIDKWIRVAVNCRVQEIDLEVGLFESEEKPICELPQCMYSSETFRVLDLDLYYKCVKEPAGVFVSLEELSLTPVFKVLNHATLNIDTLNDHIDVVTIRDHISELCQGVCCTRVSELKSVFLRLGSFTIIAHLCSTTFSTLSLIENAMQPKYAMTLKFWISKFCKQHEGFRNLIGHQLQAIKIKLKGKGHQVVAVENLLQILKGVGSDDDARNLRRPCGLAIDVQATRKTRKSSSLFLCESSLGGVDEKMRLCSGN
uniref:F-box domain-containing protein n=1 Tax=Populus alba TaxID=43335 RepID=A0A4U5Q3K5_POPAL|nr:hypothetical protein D5086_0000151440 [Populus alba]